MLGMFAYMFLDVHIYIYAYRHIRIEIWNCLSPASSTPRLPEASIEPSVIHYNATMSACEKGRQWQVGLQLFDVMPKAHTAPDIISYSSTLRGRASALGSQTSG